MQNLMRVAGWIDALNEWIGKSAAWLGLAAVLVCTGNAVARYALNIGSNAWLELQWYLNAVMFLLVAGYAVYGGSRENDSATHPAGARCR